MMEGDDLSMIVDGLERILGDASLEAIDEAGGLGVEADALWATLTGNGYHKFCTADQHGGFGGTIGDAAALVGLAGRYALALPLADTLLANGLLSACGIEAPDIRIGLADSLDPFAPLAYAAQLDAALFIEGKRLHLTRLAPGDVTALLQAEDGASRFTRVPQETLCEAATPDWLTPETTHALAAFMRAAAMSGAMETVLKMTLTYTQEREQFGRPLSKFQAIQHHLSDIACETAASIAAVGMARDALSADPSCGQQVWDEIAIAKIRCGEAAGRVAAAAHQAHGAMGFTREYALGRYTRRLWQWQDEFGSETEWASRLGHSVLAAPEPSLWARISQPS